MKRKIAERKLLEKWKGKEEGREDEDTGKVVKEMRENENTKHEK